MELHLNQYLIAVHQADSHAGLLALYNSQRVAHPRTIYRWHRSLGLSYFPTFSLSALGLVHLHLFIRRPVGLWHEFPYAVESLWLTDNLVDRVLYLHCLVPLVHQERVESLLQHLPLRCDGLRLCWSSDGWQRLRAGTFESFSQGFPQHAWPASHDGVVAPRLAFAIPVIGEGWSQRVGLPALWRRIADRLGVRVRDYLGRRRYYPTNGKSHVKDVYQSLSRNGLFRQHVIRFVDDCTLFAITDAYQPALSPHTYSALHSVEMFPCNDGSGISRLQGSYELLHSSLNAQAVYFVERTKAPEVRFCYESLFDPRQSRWIFPERAIAQRMGISS